MGSPWKSSLIIVVTTTVAACASYSGADADAMDSDAALAGDDTEDTDSVTNYTSAVEPSHYSIGGTFDVLAENVELGTTLLSFEYSNPDPLLEADNPLCTTDLALDIAATETPDFEVELYGWWQITMVDSQDCAAAQYPGPLTFRLGIGPYDSQLDPAAESAGIETENVYGLYMQLDGQESPLLVFGVAGTDDNYAGIDPPVSAVPLPDGRYDLRTLYLLPLDSP